MRKLILCATALASMILAGSCQKDAGQHAGDLAEATFSVDLPAGLSTRAIGGGTSATELYYGVFTEDGEYLQGLAQAKAVTVQGKTASFKLALVRNFTYTIVFWAQAPGAPYTFDPEEGTVTVDYSGYANDENRDAFCQVHTFTVPDKASFDQTVYLKRPFAQINFGASDFQPIADLGLGMESTVTISGLADTYAILNGTLSGSASTNLQLSTVPAQFDPAETLTVQGVDYGYVSMNYVLAPANDYQLVNVAATFAYNNDTVQLDIPNAPMQMNYRTNIVGSFFTDSVSFTIIVDEGFNTPDNDHIL